MVKIDQNLYRTYLRKGTKTTPMREQKINEIIKIIGEPTQLTQVLDMCLDYTLQCLKANPNEIKNMNVYNTKRKEYINLQNENEIIIDPTYEEREMLKYLSKRTFIKRYADIYSYTLSCVANMEKDLEEAYNE